MAVRRVLFCRQHNGKFRTLARLRNHSDIAALPRYDLAGQIQANAHALLFVYLFLTINEFIERIIVHAPEKVDGDRTQEVDIYLKFIGRFDLPAPELTPEEEKRQASLHRHRVKSRERYQKIKAGEHAVGRPFKLICKCCGEEFESKRSNSLFCGPNCRAKFYRQEAAASRSRECVCGNCGKMFTTTRSDVKYCCEACQRKAHSKMRYRQKRTEGQEAETV